jgi:hypothetical protein
MRMTMMLKTIYEPPVVDVIRVSLEKGIAALAQVSCTAYYDDWTEKTIGGDSPGDPEGEGDISLFNE